MIEAKDLNIGIKIINQKSVKIIMKNEFEWQNYIFTDVSHLGLDRGDFFITVCGNVNSYKDYDDETNQEHRCKRCLKSKKTPHEVPQMLSQKGYVLV